MIIIISTTIDIVTDFVTKITIVRSGPESMSQE
jgi:hypothetical protein